MTTETVKTYKLEVSHGSGYLVDTSIDGIFEYIKSELEEFTEDTSYTITVEHKYTQQELDNMPEFDGF